MRPKGPIPVYLCLPFSPLILKTCSHASGVLDLIWTLLIQHLGQNFEKWNPIPNNFLNFPVGRRNFLLLFLQMNVLCTKMKTVSGMAEVCGCSPACSVWIWHCIQLLSHYFILGQAVSLGGLKIPMLGTQSLLFKMWQKGTTSSVENLINGMKTFFKEKKTKQKKPQRPPEILLCSQTSEEQKPVSVSGKIRIIHVSFIALFSSLLSILWVLVQCFSQCLIFFLWDLVIICEIVFGLHGKVLVVGWTAGLTSVRTFQKLFSCPTEPVPTSSRWTFPSWVCSAHEQ